MSRRATRDCPVAARLRDAGSILLGKLNTHECALGATTNNPHFGPTRNPWNLERIPGGSSGGSGAAIAAGLATATTGTDTDTVGSIRMPASVCGVVGLKPTYGRVSKAGVLPLSAARYENERQDLGVEFIAEIERCVAAAAESPMTYLAVYKDVRRVVAKRFPFSVYFRAEARRVVVLAFFHGSRDPAIWRHRT
jgi:plasmid stabilization system protein ParE